MSKEKILVIEDDRDIQELVVFNLEKESESAEISLEKVKSQLLLYNFGFDFFFGPLGTWFTPNDTFIFLGHWYEPLYGDCENARSSHDLGKIGKAIQPKKSKIDGFAYALANFGMVVNRARPV